MPVKQGEHRGPYKNGYFREQLEKYIFQSEKVFSEWVAEHYTEAIKELGKLQPRNDSLAVTGKDGGPIEYSHTERAARVASILDRGREKRDRQPDK